jgi:hypothetical protein
MLALYAHRLTLVYCVVNVGLVRALPVQLTVIDPVTSSLEIFPYFVQT